LRITAQNFEAKIFNVSIHSACKSSLVLHLIQNYPFSKLKQKKEGHFAPNKSKQGNFFNHDACYIKN